jgi:hypothetical protein
VSHAPGPLTYTIIELGLGRFHRVPRLTCSRLLAVDRTPRRVVMGAQANQSYGTRGGMRIIGRRNPVAAGSFSVPASSSCPKRNVAALRGIRRTIETF